MKVVVLLGGRYSPALPGRGTLDETQLTPVAAVAPSDEDVAGSKPRRRRGRMAMAFLAWTVAVAAAGAAGGWELFNRHVTREAAPIEVTMVEAADAVDEEARPASAMPDVFGLTETEARQAVADAGVSPGDITVVEAPHAGDPGRIVAQEPAAGSDAPTDVELTVSTQAVVPDVVGKTGAEAADALEALGATVRQVPQFQAGATPGTVLSVDPAVGEALPEEAVVRVAAEPGQLYLDLVAPVDSDCRYDNESTVAGRSSDHGIRCTSSEYGETLISYQLPAGIQRFTASIGVTDESDPGRNVPVEVTASAGTCVGATATKDGTAEISCDFTGASTLTLRLPEAPDDDVDDVWVLVLDAKLAGDPAILDALIEEA